MVIAPPGPVNRTASSPPGKDAASPVVDTHFHVFAAGVRTAGPVRYVPAYDAPLDAWTETAGAQGVTAGVVVQPSFLGTDNTRLLAALGTAPGRLRGVAVLAPDAPDAGLDALEAAGVRGVRWNLVGGDHAVDAAMQRFASRLAARGWHVEIHADPGRLAGVLDRIPAAVPVVVDHCGRPDGPSDTATWEAARRHAARLWVKLSGAYRQHDGGGAVPERPDTMIALARRWRDVAGPAHLLWGSDWPCTNHEDWRSRVHQRGWLLEALGAADADRTLRTNPVVLYRW